MVKRAKTVVDQRGPTSKAGSPIKGKQKRPTKTSSAKKIPQRKEAEIWNQERSRRYGWP